MGFGAEDIRILRDKTGAGMMDCKKALDETSGDTDKAVEWLRKKGINTAAKKSSRNTSDGLITVNTKENSGIIVEINSETDFVARNDTFINFCADISNLSLEKKINSVQNLLKSNFLDSKLDVKDALTNIISKLGENIVINRLFYAEDEEAFFQKYVHNSVNKNSGKIGVLLEYNAKEKNDIVDEFSKNICMHVAATEPKSINISGLDEGIIENEKQIYSEQLKNSGKPKEIIEKIVLGKINKFYEEVCLLEQFFVMDTKVKIKDEIENFNKKNNLNFEIKKFNIFKLGQS